MVQLRARVMGAVCLLEVSGDHMRINLGGLDISVTEHRLQATQIGAALEQMGGETMPQQVGIQSAWNTRGAAQITNERPHRLAGERASAPAEKEKSLGRIRLGQLGAGVFEVFAQV